MFEQFSVCFFFKCVNLQTDFMKWIEIFSLSSCSYWEPFGLRKVAENDKIRLNFVTVFVFKGDDCTKQVCNLDKDSLKFFLMGDWGGLPVWPFYSPAQVNVANAMGTLGRTLETDFQISLGDNFYIIGVTNEFDKRFQVAWKSTKTAFPKTNKQKLVTYSGFFRKCLFSSCFKKNPMVYNCW